MYPFVPVANAFRMPACVFAVNRTTSLFLQALTHAFPLCMQTPNSLFLKKKKKRPKKTSCQISKSVPHMYSHNPTISPWTTSNFYHETEADLHAGNKKHCNDGFPILSAKLEERKWPFLVWHTVCIHQLPKLQTDLSYLGSRRYKAWKGSMRNLLILHVSNNLRCNNP